MKISPININYIPFKPLQQSQQRFGSPAINYQSIYFTGRKQKSFKIPNDIHPDLKFYIERSGRDGLNEYNYSLLQKICSDDIKYAEKYVNLILNSVYTKEQAEIADIVISNKEIAESRLVYQNFLDILPQQSVPYQKEISKRILANRTLYDSNDFWEFQSHLIVKQPQDKKAVDVRVDLIDKVLSNKDICENINYKKALRYALVDTYTQEEADCKYSVIKKIAEKTKELNPKYTIKKKWNDLIVTAKTPLEANFIINVLDNEQYNQNEYGLNRCFNICGDIKYKYLSKFTTRLLTDYRIYKGLPNFDNIATIIKTTTSENVCNYKNSLLDKYTSNEKLYENSSMIYHLCSILFYTKSNERLGICTGLMDKYLSNEKLYNNQSFIENIGEIIDKTVTKEQYDLKIKVIDKYLSNEELSKDEKIADKIAEIVLNTNQKEHLDIVEKIFNEEDLYKNKVLIHELPEILEPIKPSNKRVANTVLKILNNEELHSNTTLISRLHQMLSLSNLPRSIEVLETIIDDKELMSDDEFLKNCHFLMFMVESSKKYFNTVLDSYKNGEINILQLARLSSGYKKYHLNQFKKVNEIFPFEQQKNMKPDVQILLYDFINFYDLKNIEELKRSELREMLKTISSSITTVDGVIDEDILAHFPLEPHKEDSKMKLMHQITQLIKNSGKPLSKEEKEKFDLALIKLQENINNPENLKTIFFIVSKINEEQGNEYNQEYFNTSIKQISKMFNDENFKALNDSDKKVLILCLLFENYDKEKKSYNEIKNDPIDVYLMTKKFDLTENEQDKMFALSKTYNWFEQIKDLYNKINRSEKSFIEEFRTAGMNENYEIINKENETAYWLRNDNLTDMALILKKANAIENSENVNILFSNIIEKANKLKKTDLFLPVTKFPKASTIKQAINEINEDGSTDIKGVYVDEKGMVILKFNQIEEWEKIGFPKGSTSKGTIANVVDYRNNTVETETGNIKFFVHGLEKKDYIYNFDLFNLKDSDAVLSVSYAERPETKYRFFRSTGLILDIESKNVHAGGDSDSGTGKHKTLDKIYENYLFNGRSESEREFISNLLKKQLNLTDEEYVEFIEKNRNKNLAEIEPKKYATKINKIFATLNSNTRIGDRQYNEFIASNPKEVMGVYAFPEQHWWWSDNPIEILDEEKYDVFREYALERDIPFVMFGD